MKRFWKETIQQHKNMKKKTNKLVEPRKEMKEYNGSIKDESSPDMKVILKVTKNRINMIENTMDMVTGNG